jgi:hypothetical protein
MSTLDDLFNSVLAPVANETDPTKGAALVGYENDTVKDALDQLNTKLTNARTVSVVSATSAGQSVFPIPGGYPVNLIDVDFVGAHLINGVDYTATDGQNIVLVPSLAADVVVGNNLSVEAFGSFNVANAVQLTTLGTSSGASLVGWDTSTIASFFTNHVEKQVASLAELRTVNPSLYKQVFRQGYATPGDGGQLAYVYVVTASPPADNGGTYVAALGGAGYWLGLAIDKVTPEVFGAVGDYNITTGAGTVNTAVLQTMLNWCSISGTQISVPGGKKYLTDTLYLYQDAVLNPGYAAKPGRVKIVGGAGGIATGAQEAQGSAFVHINNSPKRLFQCIGSFSISNPGAGGSQVYFETVNLIGGNQTTDVLFMQDCQGQMTFDTLTVQVANPAGNGITEMTTWETTYNNILIRGQAAGTGSWTGVGLNIICDASGGQINMKLYNNVNVYKMGYGIIVGRGAQASGTFGPLVFMGGQTSLSDQHGMWLQGGAYQIVSIGQQHEQSTLNGLRIDSNAESDLPRSIKFINPYFTTCGKVADGSNNEFAINIIDGTNVEIDSPLFQNANSGIAIQAVTALNCLIRRPVFRTITTYGQASGRGISLQGAYTPANRIKLVDPTYNFNFLTNIDDVNNVLAAGNARYESTAGNLATPSIYLAASVDGNDAARVLNLNNTTATTVTNILGGEMFQTLLLTFGNTNTTIASNGNIYLQGGENFTPVNSQQTLTLYYNGVWKEVGRSQPPSINPLSITNNSATPDLTSHTAPTNVVIFNNTAATTVTNMTSGVLYQTLTLAFGNLNTTIANSPGFIQLKGNKPFTPTSVNATLTLYYDGVWKEQSRTGGVQDIGVVATSAVAVPLTGTTSMTPLATIAVPGNSMGPNGWVEIDMVFSWTNSANTKTMQVTFGGVLFQTQAISATGTTSGRWKATLQNRGVTNSQVAAAPANGGVGTNSTGPVTASIDTTQNQNIVFQGQLGLGTETLQLERYSVTVNYA